MQVSFMWNRCRRPEYRRQQNRRRAQHHWKHKQHHQPQLFPTIPREEDFFCDVYGSRSWPQAHYEPGANTKGGSICASGMGPLQKVNVL